MISSHQINTQTTCSGADQEDTLLRTRRTEIVYLVFPFLKRRSAIKTAELYLSQGNHVLDDVKHTCEAGKD